MIIDVSFISQWNDLDKIEKFDELFKKTQSLINIGLIPENTAVYKFLYFFEAPLSIVLKLYYLKALESEGEMRTYCFNKVVQIYNKPQFKSLRIYYNKEFEEAKKYYIKWYKPPLDILYGEEKAKEVKNKIAKSMSNLDEETITNRNKSISNYAKNRPESHNKHISEALKLKSQSNHTN
ncbi:MAG: hypothetical protein HUJ68_10735 [Clostridia bacterium]|nr:hypothetical protein [Clostridia bacterium]